MNSLLAKLQHATGLTRAGHLHAATQSIQEALHGRARPHGRFTETSAVSAVILDPVGSPAPTMRQGLLPGPETIVRRPRREPARTTDTPQGRFLHRTYAAAEGTLHYRLFAPPQHEGKALPLIVMLHGCTQDPVSFATGTGMNQAAMESGFFVLYPAQPASANPNRCWNWFEPSHQQRGHGEPALIAGMTREVISQFGIDVRRVYVAGLSAGGAMAAILGETYPDLFAAIGVHSGLPTGTAHDMPSAFAAMQGPAKLQAHARHTPAATGRVSTPAVAVPTIVFHGDRDTTVHRANGRQIIERIATATTTTMQQERKRALNGREYTRTLHHDASGNIVCEHWIVHGAGHAWSGGRAGGSYTDASGPDATAAMLKFFLSHAKTLDKASTIS